MKTHWTIPAGRDKGKMGRGGVAREAGSVYGRVVPFWSRESFDGASGWHGLVRQAVSSFDAAKTRPGVPDRATH